MNLYEVLRKPLVTEKSTRLSERNKYVFEVDKKASKDQVRLAVEKAFKVAVLHVNMIIIPGETKKMGKRQITGAARKKAIVTLKEGDKIQFFEGV
jgi:large subunit ribosomal protein L23